MCKITEGPLSSTVSSPCGAAKELVVMDHDDLHLPLEHDEQEQPQGQRQRQRQQQHPSDTKRVRFGETTEHVFERNFTQDDMSRIWYNGDEFQAIKSEIYAMIRFASNHGKKYLAEDTHGWNWRGWEHVREKRPRKEVRRRHSEDLLYFHKVLNVTDPEGIAIYAESSSRPSSERARSLAVLDESEAYEIYNDTLAELETLCYDMGLEATTATTECDPQQETQMELEDCDELPSQKVDACLSICRDDKINPIHLLEQDGRQAALLPQFDEDEASVLSLFLISPYELAVMLLPCVC